MKHNHSVTILRKSCLTGKVVWIYCGPSKNAARAAYWRACQKELERVRLWNEKMQRRRASIRRFLNDCTASLPIDAEMSPDQKEAARQLQAIERKGPDCDKGFYDHVIEERRRRAEDGEIRRQMRERNKQL